MKKILVSAALMLSLASVPAFAKRDRDERKEKSDKREWKDKEKDKERDKEERKEHKEKREKDDEDGNSQGHRRAHDSDHDRDRDRVAGQRPAGWSKGKKTGWGDCNVPPGQAKKEGCRGTASRRPVVVANRRDPKDHDRRHTTTTTTSTTPSNRGTHPFTPVLRQKQEGSNDTKHPRQSVK